MRRIQAALPMVFVGLMLGLLVLPGTLTPPQAQSAPPQAVAKYDDLALLQKRIQEVVRKVRPSVVAIRMSNSSGSGCFISDDGWVATAGHVSGTKPGTKCRVVLHGGESLDAEVYGWHEAMDYGLVKADTKGKKVPFSELGESGKVKAGEWLIPMGHPLGPEPGRDAVVRAGRCLIPENARSMIVIDAPVISGDSGGPVFNLDGKIIAINQSIQTNNVSINNVTPVDLFKTMLKDFKDKKGFGNANGPQWGTGVKAQQQGALSQGEMRDYQAAVKAYEEKKYKASVELFDKILQPEKRPPDVLYNAACTYALYAAELKGKEADEMAAKAVRTLTRSVEAGWRDMDHAANDPDLASLRQRKDYQEWVAYGRKANKRPIMGLMVRSNRGIRVSEVMPKSPAEAAGFQVDDIIERVGTDKIEELKDWVACIAEKGLSDTLEIRVNRKGKRQALKLSMPSFGARIFGQGGAKIVEVLEGGLAFAAGLRPSDIVIRAGDTKVEGALDFVNALTMADASEEMELQIRRGYSREIVKFSYSTGDVGGGDGTLARDEWKQGNNLLKLWEQQVGRKAKGAVFPVRQKGKQVSFATAVHAEGLLLAKGSEINPDDVIEVMDGTTAITAKVVARNPRYDIVLLKCERKFSAVIDFIGGTQSAEFPEVGTMLASVDAKGAAFAHGFVALPPYDTDKLVGEPDPNAPFMGINARDAADGGAEVTSITPAMPAANAGLRVGDIIRKMDGQVVPDWNSMVAMIRGCRADQTVELTVLRGTETVVLSMTLKPRAEALGEKPRVKGTGKPELGIAGGRAKGDGMEIGMVKAGSPAELGGIQSGELLLRLDDIAIKEQRDLDTAIRSRKIGDTVSLVLLRDKAEVTIEVQLAEEDAPPPPPGNGRPNVKGPISDRYTHLGKVIQHDGVVMPNQQGGPVFDLQGNVVGLNIARADRTRTFALSKIKVAEILADLMRQVK